MKATKLKMAVGLAALASTLAGTALAQDTSNVVGYEDNNIIVGFNYLGQRLVGSADISTTVSGIAGTTITLAADSGLAGVRSVFEVNSGTAAGTVTIADVNGTGAVTDDDLSSEIALGDSVTVRELATLASVVGDPSTLTGAGTAAAADIILIPDGLGDFRQFYYNLNAFGSDEWKEITPGGEVTISAASIEIPYTDGIVVNAKAANSLTITGDVKTADTALAAIDGFNYYSSIYPAGANLETAFGADPTARGALGLTGAGTAGAADIVFVPDGAGDFNQYYYNLNAFGTDEWKEITTGGEITATPASVLLDSVSGIVVNNKGGAQNLLITPPGFYANL